MKRNDAEQIGKLIQQYLRQESLESPLNEQRLLDAWPQGLGPAASYTSTSHFRRPSSGTDDGTGTSGAYSESESRGYGYHKHYFSLRKGILSVTFIPSFWSVPFARS